MFDDELGRLSCPGLPGEEAPICGGAKMSAANNLSDLEVARTTSARPDEDSLEAKGANCRLVEPYLSIKQLVKHQVNKQPGDDADGVDENQDSGQSRCRQISELRKRHRVSSSSSWKGRELLLLFSKQFSAAENGSSILDFCSSCAAEGERGRKIESRNNNNVVIKQANYVCKCCRRSKLKGRQIFAAFPKLPLMLVCFSIMIIMSANSVPGAHGVDCFKCSSRNGSNPACEDPFHNLNTTKITTPMLPDPAPNVIYHAPCYAGKKGREGLFLASACIKLTGTFDATGETLIVRHCALDSGSLTQDTELARMSHCGKFQFENDLLKGCVLACPEDACNSSLSTTQPSRIQLALIVLALVMVSVLTTTNKIQPRYGPAQPRALGNA